ncbi:hypothetical protein HUJ04_005691 [Dendroctonus ponderosae]|uniref:2',5'-phosphodiesterase 12 n=2 Tax=Dendroctonus ponderosae TaxID=77166 RepID=A0AAR5P4K7_DENPD|nr:hypothetical protein HUJ04_005691 [Dendroctonus ponderosae]
MLSNNFFKLLHSRHTLSCFRLIHRVAVQMDTAYLRHCPDGERFDITFELKDERLNRQFNLSRKLSETVDAFVVRVKANVDKALSKKKKKKDAPVQLATVALLLDNQEVSKDWTCERVFSAGAPVQLAINERTFNVVINAPLVVTLNLASSFLATFPTYPAKFESLFTEQEISEFVWFKSKDETQWEQVGQGFIYTPSNSDIDCYLKLSCTPKNHSLTGPICETVSSGKVAASPGECPFERRQAFTKENLQGTEFRVVSYNILADLYTDSDYTREVLFPYCPPYALSIDYRKQLFLKEIIGYHADIICLQEVDRKVFKYDLNTALSHLGYEGVLHTKGTEVAEGLALFYNTARFILLDSQKLLFSEEIPRNPVFADIWDRIKENPKLSERILARTTALQVNLLGALESDELLVVANTHLFFHPDADHIRLLHGCLAIRYLQHVVRTVKERYPGKRVSLIFCGDFNSVPTCGVYQLYTTGSIPGDVIDYSSNPEEAICNINMTHPFKLASACGTPKYTNFTVAFADCLDYIFYETAHLKVTQVVPLPSEEELRANSAIPSTVFPSDHVALVSDLKWL